MRRIRVRGAVCFRRLGDVLAGTLQAPEGKTSSFEGSTPPPNPEAAGRHSTLWNRSVELRDSAGLRKCLRRTASQRRWGLQASVLQAELSVRGYHLPGPVACLVLNSMSLGRNLTCLDSQTECAVGVAGMVETCPPGITCNRPLLEPGMKDAVPTTFCITTGISTCAGGAEECCTSCWG